MPKLSPDQKWRGFNKKLNEYMKLNDFWGIGTTYYEMAGFLESEGKDSREMRELGYQMKLKASKTNFDSYKSLGVTKKVEILAALDSCKECKKMDGKVCLIEEAEKKAPIPVKNCTHKYGCRCIYIPVIDG